MMNHHRDAELVKRNWNAFVLAGNCVAARRNLNLWRENCGAPCTFDDHFTFTFQDPMHAGQVYNGLYLALSCYDADDPRVSHGKTWVMEREGAVLRIVDLERGK